jgi:predicted small metal-binding protein
MKNTVESIVSNIWNHIADKHNQWSAISEEEKNELMDIAITSKRKGGKDERSRSTKD